MVCSVFNMWILEGDRLYRGESLCRIVVRGSNMLCSALRLRAWQDVVSGEKTACVPDLLASVRRFCPVPSQICIEAREVGC